MTIKAKLDQEQLSNARNPQKIKVTQNEMAGNYYYVTLGGALLLHYTVNR